MIDFETLKSLFMVLLSGFAGVMWWLYQKVDSKLDAQEKDMAEFKLHVAENYVNQSDLADAMHSIKEVLGGMSRQIGTLTTDLKEFSTRVYDKLDRKADKA